MIESIPFHPSFQMRGEIYPGKTLLWLSGKTISELTGRTFMIYDEEHLYLTKFGICFNHESN
jgi:hypothetical protein